MYVISILWMLILRKHCMICIKLNIIYILVYYTYVIYLQEASAPVPVCGGPDVGVRPPVPADVRDRRFFREVRL